MMENKVATTIEGLGFRCSTSKALIEDTVAVGSEEDTVSKQLLWHATPEEEDDVPDQVWELMKLGCW